jgi:hypothetical protein
MPTDFKSLKSSVKCGAYRLSGCSLIELAIRFIRTLSLKDKKFSVEKCKSMVANLEREKK